MRFLTLIIPFVATVLWLVFSPAEEDKPHTPKMNGASLVNPPREITREQMAELKQLNVGWVAIIPYAFAQSGEPEISFNHERQWWGERTEGTKELISLARECGMKIMLKPHVWVRGEGWTGDFTLNNEHDWKKWEEDFSNYILHFASLADSLDVELFSIGTEYRIPARERPDYWRKLIGEVRKVYQGNITYASNWDNFMNISWWDAVDYLGVDAYFPLVDKENPSTRELIKGWEPIVNELETFAEKWDKPILFTEYGFQSMNGAAGKHWELDRKQIPVNEELQALAYDATFQSFMSKKWYAGGFFWKWYFFQRSPEQYTTDWTPQNKKAEQIIAKWYGQSIGIQ
ncbi:MAG: hypothetical protein RLO17_27395 [Cyclobacteriaceae bacterium]